MTAGRQILTSYRKRIQQEQTNLVHIGILLVEPKVDNGNTFPRVGAIFPGPAKSISAYFSINYKHCCRAVAAWAHKKVVLTLSEHPILEFFLEDGLPSGILARSFSIFKCSL